jgi:DNA-binding NarL/FixJ family response regulator
MVRTYFGAELRLIEATSVDEAIAAGRSALPDLHVVMVDLGLPDGSGWQVVAELHACDPTLRFLVVSALEDTDPPAGIPAELLQRVLFVDKPTSGRELLAVAAYSYHLVRQDRGGGGSTVPPEPQVDRLPKHDGLSHRESQAMRGCMMGLTNQEIGEQLGIAFGTARKHVSAALEKLDVTSRDDVARALDGDRGRGERD